MADKVRKITTIVMWSLIGVFIGSRIWQYVDYRSHPDIYGSWSAPWYTPLIVRGFAVAVIVLICIVIRILAGRTGRR